MIAAQVFYPTSEQRSNMYAAAMDINPLCATVDQRNYVLALAAAHNGVLKQSLQVKADMITRAIAARHTRLAIKAAWEPFTRPINREDNWGLDILHASTQTQQAARGLIRAELKANTRPLEDEPTTLFPLLPE